MLTCSKFMTFLWAPQAGHHKLRLRLLRCPDLLIASFARVNIDPKNQGALSTG